MKASEIRDLNRDEILSKIGDFTQELFNLRFQQATGQLENTAKIEKTKRTIARFNTILNEMKR